MLKGLETLLGVAVDSEGDAMEEQTPKAKANVPRHRKAGAAEICRTFMENEGWLQLERIARGEPYVAWVRGAGFAVHKSVRVQLTPDLDQRLTALKLLTAYGYGRPAELASADDSGRTVTDLLLAALRPQGHNEEGPR